MIVKSIIGNSEKTRLEMLCALLLENARLLQLLLCVQLNKRWNWKLKSIAVVSVSEFKTFQHLPTLFSLLKLDQRQLVDQRGVSLDSLLIIR